MNQVMASVCVCFVALVFSSPADSQDDQHFANVAVQASNAGESQGKDATYFEFDNDGDLDIRVAQAPSAQVGRGIAVGDFDNDGWIDLFVAGEQLYRNDGKGRFTDVSQSVVAPRSIETIKIEGGKVEITRGRITVDGAKREIILRQP